MKIHIVKQGDSLYALSQKYGVPLQTIIEANPQISNPDVLVIGDKVKIPAGATPVPDNNEVFYKHTVKQGDTLWKLSKAWGITLKDMIDANPQLKNPNVLMVGEIVNIPKKGNNSAANPQSIASTAINKPNLGAKEYTGPKEQPNAVAPNVNKAPEVAPIVNKAPEVAPIVNKAPEVAPIVNKAPEVAPIVNKAPEVAPIVNKAPEVVPIVNKAPEVAPIVNKAPEVAPIVNKAPEVAPIHEVIHEKQSLFVQISVPAQEAKTFEMPKEKSKSEVQPTSWYENKVSPCEKSAGYPGLYENPYFMDCPPAYPYYEPMGVMGMNSAPNYIQPAAYMPDCVTPYSYPENIYPSADYPEAWHPNMAPEYSNISPVSENPSYAMPQYGGQSMNLPWPSCGCGGGMPVQPIQPYSYEQPMYNNYPAYMQPQPGMISPYEIGMEPKSNIAPIGTLSGPMVSNIPSYPMYPGMENYAHNRVPEIQEPEFIQQDVPQAVEAERSEPAAKSKGGETKASSAKVKTSAQATISSNNTSAKQRSKQSSRKSTVKKSKNPWISR
ncbi:LysM peptidoglycan-binding domain-containing protein [Paenibacillus sp. BAC0078]